MFGTVVICALVWIAYRPILPGNFLMDDRRLVDTDNPLVTGELTPASIWFQTDFALSTFAFWREWLAWGAHPGGFHAVNMLLHAIGAIFLWRVLRELRIPGAWLAAAVFAVHPVCVNSVARISELKNTLSLPFCLLSAWLYLPNLNPNPNLNRSALRYPLSLVFFILALMAKTSTIMLPVVFLIFAAWQNGRITRRDVLHAGPFFLVALAFGLMSSWFQRHQAMIGSTLAPESFRHRLAESGYVLWFYLGKALAPLKLNLVYPQWKIDAGSPVAYIPAFLFVMVIMVCWWFRRGWGRHALAALAIFAVTLFPALGFMDSQFLTKWRVSDHLQYLPLIAPVTLAVAALARFFPGLIFRGVTFALVLCLLFLTHQRAQIFASEESLFRDTLAKNPAAWGTHNDLGVILAAHEKYKEAEAEFAASLKCNPDNPDTESNLAQALAAQGKFRAAEPHFLVALKERPYDPEIHKRYAAALSKTGRIPEARYHLRQVLALSPKPETRVRLDYATMLHMAGDFQGAIFQLRRVLLTEPDSVEALNNLAWLLATAPDDTLRNGAEAVKLAERASICRLLRTCACPEPWPPPTRRREGSATQSPRLRKPSRTKPPPAKIVLPASIRNCSTATVTAGRSMNRHRADRSDRSRVSENRQIAYRAWLPLGFLGGWCPPTSPRKCGMENNVVVFN